MHALIRKEFERNKNESRPEVVEVCEFLSPFSSRLFLFPLAEFMCLLQNLKSNAAAALTHYLFYASALPVIKLFCLQVSYNDSQISSKGDKEQAAKEFK